MKKKLAKHKPHAGTLAGSHTASNVSCMIMLRGIRPSKNLQERFAGDATMCRSG